MGKKNNSQPIQEVVDSQPTQVGTKPVSARTLRKRRKVQWIPHTRKDDTFDEQQRLVLINTTALFGTMLTFCILSALALIAFVIVTVGLELVVFDSREILLAITFAIWVVLAVFAVIAAMSYYKIAKHVSAFRKANKEQDDIDAANAIAASEE